MEVTFSGRNILVTGGFSGIGLSVVEALARFGANVYAIDIASTAPAELQAKANVWCTPNGNIADVSVCKAFIDSIQGDIHGLVNCAGISPFENKLASYDLYRQIIETNVTGTWAMGTEAIRRMSQQEPLKCIAGNGIFTAVEKQLGQGSIINVSSGGGIRGIPSKAVYCASKHAVIGLTRTWSRDWPSIRFNAVCPGMTNTVLLRGVGEGDEARTKFIKAAEGRIPMGRLAEPTDIADVIMFLLSDASSFMTGQVLPVNGGAD